MIVQRLNSIIGKLIHPNQASFISGRQIVNNIIVDQKMLYAFKRSKSKMGVIIKKIGMEKPLIGSTRILTKHNLIEVGLLLN